MVRVLFGVLVSLALSGTVAAAPSIQRGGPARDADRARLTRALDDLAGMLGVCWRGARPKAVAIEVRVAADGTVERATAKTKGKVAACAAAVLAVQELPKSAKGYRARLMFATTGGGSAKASTRESIMAAIDGSKRVARCRAKARDVTGRAEVRFLVKPKGRVVDVDLARSTLSDPAVGRCLVAAVEALDLDLDNRKTFEFAMPFAFDGGGGGTGDRAPSSSGDASLRPTKKGPVETSELSRVMKAARAKFTACYDTQAAKDPGLAGDVVLRYTIRANGTTRNVKIKRSTLNNRAVENCMVRVGKKLRFSSRSGRKETRVVYPFRFARR